MIKALRNTPGWSLTITNGGEQHIDLPLDAWEADYASKTVQINLASKPKRIECASVNCDREGKLENKVQGKLDLRQSSDATGPSIWVEAYLCDVCLKAVRDGHERDMSVGYQPPKCLCQGGQEWCKACGDRMKQVKEVCPCDRCTKRRERTEEFWSKLNVRL